jgi:hypothetical protein
MIATLGIKIYTGGSDTDSDIGLYSGELHWILNSFSGSVGSWKAGILLSDGVSPIREGGDYLDGGDYANIRGMSIEIDNTLSIISQLENLDIFMNGLRAEVIEFEKRGDGSVVERIIFSGKTNIEPWDETHGTINI